MQAGQTGLKVLIGSGPLYVGEVGHSSLRGPDAFGEELFNAATLQSKGIAVTDAAKRRLGDRYQVRALPERPVPWQPEPLRGWELVE